MPNSQTMRKSRDSIIPDKLLVNSQILGRVGLYSFKQSFLATKTTNVDRGTVTLMAPEILLNKLPISHASIADLLLAEMWALGMILFCVIMVTLALNIPFAQRSDL